MVMNDPFSTLGETESQFFFTLAALSTCGRRKAVSSQSFKRRYNSASFLALAQVLVILAFSLSTALAQGTAFTYQGRLNSGGNPANGRYDLTFALYDAARGGGQKGHTPPKKAPANNHRFFTLL